MNESIELLKGAYDCLIGSPSNEEVILLTDCIRQYLDQPEQEPVAWMYEWYEGDTESTSIYCGSEKPFQEDGVKPFNLRPLYEHPKRDPMTQREAYQRGYAQAEHDLKREPLSDEKIIILGVQNLCNEANSFKPFGFARAIEKAHGIGGEI